MPEEQITRILDAVSAGDSRAAEELLPLVYDQLRELAQSRMRKLNVGGGLRDTDGDGIPDECDCPADITYLDLSTDRFDLNPSQG